MSDSIVIVSAARTPIGGMLGDFSALAAHELGARRHQGRGRARRRPRRRRRRGADGQLPDGRPGPGAGAPGRARRRPAQSAGAVTLSQDVRLGHARDDVRATTCCWPSSADVMVAGGMESMTNAPHLTFVRKGVRYGAGAAVRPHGARRPGRRLRARQGDGRVRRGVRRQVPVHAARRRTSSRSPRPSAQDGQRGRQLRLGDRAGHACRARAARRVIKFDEQPFKAKLDKIPGLKPAFKKDGTITAATSSSISDGAAALVLMRESTAAALGAQADRAHRRATPCTRRRRTGSPPRRSARSRRC